MNERFQPGIHTNSIIIVNSNKNEIFELYADSLITQAVIYWSYWDFCLIVNSLLQIYCGQSTLINGEIGNNFERSTSTN